MIKVLSTGCPNCRILKKKLEENNINHTEINNVNEILSYGVDKVPAIVLEDNTILSYQEALKWVSLNKEDD